MNWTASKSILFLFQMCSDVLGKKVWKQSGETQVCSGRVSSERHQFRYFGEGRVFHHLEKSFAFPWRLLQIFPWHSASVSWSHRGCSSVMFWRLNITSPSWWCHQQRFHKLCWEKLNKPECCLYGIYTVNNSDLYIGMYILSENNIFVYLQ